MRSSTVATRRLWCTFALKKKGTTGCLAFRTTGSASSRNTRNRFSVFSRGSMGGRYPARASAWLYANGLLKVTVEEFGRRRRRDRELLSISLCPRRLDKAITQRRQRNSAKYAKR